MIKEIGKKIRQHRELRGYSQEYLAQELEIAIKTYSRYETEEISPTIDRLNKICQILEMDTVQLIDSDLGNVFNNNNYHSEGDFVAYNATSIKEVKDLYEKLLTEKELRIVEMKEVIDILKNR